MYVYCVPRILVQDSANSTAALRVVRVVRTTAVATIDPAARPSRRPPGKHFYIYYFFIFFTSR